MTRPWVTPAEVKNYTEITAVSERSDSKLAVDISRAEQYVITYTHNDFSAAAYATTIPSSVRTAVIILAEAYARQAVISAKQTDFAVKKNGMKSETYDDYSYTASESVSDLDIDALNLSSLLDDYVLAKATGNVTLRLRKL